MNLLQTTGGKDELNIVFDSFKRVICMNYVVCESDQHGLVARRKL